MLLSLILALPLSNDHITLLKYQGALGPQRHTLDLDTCALREAAIARAVPASVWGIRARRGGRICVNPNLRLQIRLFALFTLFI